MSDLCRVCGMTMGPEVGELVDHGQYGMEAPILHNDEHYMSHTFAPRHAIPFNTPRAAAIHWAERERKAIEESPDEWY